ncbi:MAG: histidine kinase dimerization/phosphoacceptor domain -containing protein [Chitinophagaceae bacterium]
MRLRLVFILCCWLALPGLSQKPGFSEQEARSRLAVLRTKKPSAEQVDLQLQWAAWLVNGIGQPSARVDSAFTLASQAQEYSRQLRYKAGEGKSSFQLAHIAEINHQYQQAKLAADDAVRIFKSLSAYDELGETYVSLWSITTNAGQPEPGDAMMDYFLLRISYLDSAAKAFRQAGNKMRLADCLREEGDLLYITNRLPAARMALQESLALYQEIKYPRLMSVYDLLGSLHVAMGDYERGVEYGLKAIQTAEALGDTSLSMCTYYNRLGSSYFELGDTAKSSAYFDKALQIAIRFDDKNYIANIASSISEQLVKTGRARQALDFLHTIFKRYPAIRDNFKIQFAWILIPAYLELKEYEQAAPQIAFLEKVAERKGFDPEVYALIYTALIPYYVATQQNLKAVQYAGSFRAVAQKLNRADYAAQYSLLQFRVDSATGDLLSAIKHFQRYKIIKDSLLTERKSRQIEYFNVQYETAKKEKNIQSLQRAAEIQEDHLHQADTREKITLVGAALILMIAGLLLYAYNLKKKANAALLKQQQLIEEKNEALNTLVKEKDWLMREIHHRVKNNLHMVVGLLASQAEYIKGKEALDAISESQHRVQAMSIIHQKLYQSENLSFTNMADYFRELTDYLQDSLDKSIPVRFILDVEKVNFPLSLSIPLGLIVNEAVTNSFKYAFSGRSEGEINLSFKQAEPGYFRLIIRDNGIGFANSGALQKNASLGLSLIRGLSEDIKGHLGISNENGLKIEINFPLP